MPSLVEQHPFKPYLPDGTRVVLCGTFPPKKDKWSMDFFYPNFYNDMWRIFGLIFFDDKEHFFNKNEKKIDKEGIQAMLTNKKIGIGETVIEARRLKDNASDKFLEVITPVDLPQLLKRIPDCKDIVTTGEKAASVIAALTNTEIPKVGENKEFKIKIDENTIRYMRHWRMPSTSRAFPMKLENKTEYYKEMLRAVGIIN
ncbi:MAG: uracil-DNA glycosylase family protein [Muribaculaceae bacterium]|nr:uracil-DNA glycosylase family protein [Muribaculaceae bacterium]